MTVLASCAPVASPTAPAAPAPEARPVSSAPRVLRVGLQREPAGFLRPGSTGQMILLWLTHDDLTVPDGQGQFLPRLAAEIPSLDRNTWVVAPDGSMDVTWKLRPNVKWQDGTPVTSDDYLAFWEYLHSPVSISEFFEWTLYADRITAPDPLTFVVHFPQTVATASIGYSAGGPLLQPLPRHILGDLLARGDIEAFTNSPHWSDQFVGVGPYRLLKWERGTSMEFARFDDYFLGTPAVDRVMLKFYPDLNAMVSTFLAGELDVCENCKFSAEQAVDLERRWEGTGNTVMIGTSDKVNFMESQSRPEVTPKPRALRDPRVRQALYRAIDREVITEAIGSGTMQSADSWIPPQDPRRQTLAPSIIQYPYDRQRAERELQALGWQRGSDGVLTNQDGERFEVELRTYPDAFAGQLLAVTGDFFKNVGVAAQQSVNTPQQMNDREYLSLFPGLQYSDNPGRSIETGRLRTANVGTPTNRYAGNNRGGYSSPQMDALYDRLSFTIPDDQRTQVQTEILQVGLTDLPLMPVFWGMVVHVAAANVRNIPRPSALLVDPRNQNEWTIGS
jgi:peptide/nickel transport system substrate-binding protein